MKYFITSSILFCCCLSCVRAFAQFGFALPEGQKSVEIPFKEYNNLIVLSIKLKNTTTVNFILDTNIEHAILTDKRIGDQLNLNYVRKILLGQTGDQAFYGYVAIDAQMSLADSLQTSTSQNLLVLETDYLNLASTAGTKVHGLIGYDIFKSFVVEINNTKSVMVLHDPKVFKKPKGYQALPITLVARKPYINAKITFEDWQTTTRSFLVKTGAGHALFFEDDSVEFHLPFRNIEVPIGQSFGGEIIGHLGRLRTLEIGKFSFQDPIATFAKLEHIANRSKTGIEKKGSIGQGILQRFNLIFDYFNEKLYLKKIPGNYDKRFEYDMSGLSIEVLQAPNYTFNISSVRKNSPAAKAGIRKGDLIKSINGENLSINNYGKFISYFLSKEGKKVALTLQRGAEEIKMSYKLVRFI